MFEKAWKWNSKIYSIKYPYREIQLGKKFEVDVMGVENDRTELQEELLQLQGDRVLKERFVRMSLTKLSGKPTLNNENKNKNRLDL